MTNEIFIENKQVDISEGLSNLITFAIDDIKDIGSRNTSFSKTIILPGTARNNALFGHIFDVTAMNPYDADALNTGLNFNASKKADCVIFQNHIQVFKGIFRLLKIVINSGVPEYECAVFGELGGLINSIGNKKIEELDFSAYDHVLSISNVTGSWDNASGAGYFYPLADYGNVSTDKIDYDIKAFRPALFIREYIDKIITDAGYSFSSALFETQRFKQLVIPNNQITLQTITDRLVQGIDVSTQTIIQNGVVQEAPIPQATRTASGFTYFGGVWTYTGTDTKTFKVKGRVSGDYYSTIESIQIQVKKNGTQVYTGVPFLAPTFGTTDVLFSHTIQSSPTDDFVLVTMATGDTIEFSAKVANNVGSYRMRTTFVSFEIYNPIPIFVDLPLGGTVVINDTTPRNILQRDLLSSVLRLFNIYATEDNLKNKFLQFTPYVDFYNVSGVVDWTYKLDRSRQIELTPMSELNSRYYDFTFKSDSDYYNELYKKRYGQNYGDYLFDSEFFFTADKGEIPVIFSGTPLVGYAGVDKIVSAYYKLTNGIEDGMNVNIRILQTKKITGVTSWDITNAGSVLGTLTSYGYAGHYDDPDAPANDIHFGVPSELFFTLVTGAINVTQFNVYWSSYMAEITDKDSKLLSAWFKLTNSDIYNLDFGKFVYVDGSYFRLNKIIDWNTNEPDLCKVELLKVIYNQY